MGVFIEVFHNIKVMFVQYQKPVYKYFYPIKMKEILQELFNPPSCSHISNDYIKQSDTLETFSNFALNNYQECNSTLQAKKYSNIHNKKKINKELELNNKHNCGHWTPEEHQTYVEFLEKHHTSTMQNQQNRKNNKIFKLMSEIIGTRSPSQCRSHHQKFNPYTPAGQKRIKKNKKKFNTETQIKLCITNQILQYFTPDLRPIQELLPNIQDQDEQQEYICEESQRLRIRKYSLDNLEDSYNFNHPHINQFFNEQCYD
ncbi:unnamed protein product [Paramecium sonneborni]|uniref:Myb-like domain-containing protein n=1 Tax=Paramecium sonneborni TaxID=65129 RepID=A0A8S1P2I7_9CILI|nr:unnamed protein product [Paramecium sonneborni]